MEAPDGTSQRCGSVSDECQEKEMGEEASRGRGAGSGMCECVITRMHARMPTHSSIAQGFRADTKGYRIVGQEQAGGGEDGSAKRQKTQAHATDSPGSPANTPPAHRWAADGGKRTLSAAEVSYHGQNGNTVKA